MFSALQGVSKAEDPGNEKTAHLRNGARLERLVRHEPISLGSNTTQPDEKTRRAAINHCRYAAMHAR